MIQINGKEYQFDSKKLTSVLEDFEYDRRLIAVEINEEIIPKANYDDTVLKSGDVVEIVSFVGGG